MASNFDNRTSTPKRTTFTLSQDERKRLWNASPKNKCSRCNNVMKNDECTECKGCNLPFCRLCTGLSRSAFSLLKSEELDDYSWHCKSCKTTIPTLLEINRNIKELSTKQEKRLTDLEERFNNLDLNTNKKISEQLDVVKVKVKSEIRDEVKKDLEGLVENRFREMEDRSRRRLNIVVFNLEEGHNKNGKENQLLDESKIKYIAEILGVKDLLIQTSYRLGKPKTHESNSKPRPLKLILIEKEQRKLLLDNTSKIKNLEDEKLRKVIIVKDMTETQRKEKKERRNYKPNSNPKSRGKPIEKTTYYRTDGNLDDEQSNKNNLSNLGEGMDTTNMDLTILTEIKHGPNMEMMNETERTLIYSIPENAGTESVQSQIEVPRY
ncbi:hypothetical protein ACF0H5_003293 [Mactra antiquata]